VERETHAKQRQKETHVLRNPTSDAAILPVDESLQVQKAAAGPLWWSLSDSTLTLPTPTLHRQQRREVCLVITKHEEEGDGSLRSTRRRRTPAAASEASADFEVLALPF